MDKNITQYNLPVYKDNFGFYPTPKPRLLSCRTVEKVDTVQLFPSGVSVGGGKMAAPGDEFHSDMPATDLTGITLIDAVKLRTPKGFVYATQAAFNTWVASCDSCCTS